MKKLLLLVTSFSIFMLGLVTVDAKNINIAYDANNLATQNNIYIVGNWVFQLNKYAINGYDVGYASTKYALRTEGEAAKYVPIYTLANGNVYIVDEHGLASGIKYVGTIEEIFPGGVINATGLNETEFNDEDDFELTVIEPKIKESVQKLKTTEKGFKSISYSNHRITFEIDKIDSLLKDYKDETINLLNGMLDDSIGFQNIQFNGKTYNKEGLDVTALAIEVLRSVSNNQNQSTMTYYDVANTSTNATVLYKDPKTQEEYSITYYLDFNYDIEKGIDKILKEFGNALNLEALGFTYDDATNTLDFTTGKELDATKTLSELVNENLNSNLDALKKYLNTYDKMLGSVKKITIEFNNQTEVLDESAIAEYIKIIQGRDITNFKAKAKELLNKFGVTPQNKLSEYAGKTATITVEYQVGNSGETVTYNIK